eukprot:3946740-Pyramimonas_sp.AAC.1
MAVTQALSLSPSWSSTPTYKAEPSQLQVQLSVPSSSPQLLRRLLTLGASSPCLRRRWRGTPPPARRRGTPPPAA